MKVKFVAIHDDHVQVTVEDSAGVKGYFRYPGTIRTTVEAQNSGSVYLTLSVTPTSDEPLVETEEPAS